jgi:hypothetical protein
VFQGWALKVQEKQALTEPFARGVAVHVHLESSRRDISALLFSVTPENTDGSANARGSGGRKGEYTPAQVSNSAVAG